jgi:hypothetical protein
MNLSEGAAPDHCIKLSIESVKYDDVRNPTHSNPNMVTGIGKFGGENPGE